MSVFFAGAALMMLLAAGFVGLALRARAAEAADAGDARRAQNLAAWRAACEELDRQRDDGRLSSQEHAEARLELDRRLLAEADAGPLAVHAGEGGKRALVAVMLAVPVAAVLVYSLTGSLAEVGLDADLRALENISDPAQRSERLIDVLPRLEAAADRRDPDGNYRYLLARGYTTLGRHAEAAARYAQLVELYPEDAGLLAQQAQALYLASDRQLTPAIQALVDRALTIDPTQVTLLGMVGMDRFQNGDYAGAVEAWEKLLKRLPADAPDAAVIRDGITMARERIGGGEGTPGAAHGSASGVAAASGAAEAAEPTEPAEAAGQPAAAGEGPRLRVAVSAGAGRSLPAGATVFVFARAVKGPPMPLAVARFAVAELPREVLLDDSMAMAPGMSLSSFPEVTVTARVSQSGTVNSAPGDLEGSSGPVRVQPGEQSLAVVIDRTL